MTEEKKTLDYEGFKQMTRTHVEDYDPKATDLDDWMSLPEIILRDKEDKLTVLGLAVFNQGMQEFLSSVAQGMWEDEDFKPSEELWFQSQSWIYGGPMEVRNQYDSLTEMKKAGVPGVGEMVLFVRMFWVDGDHEKRTIDGDVTIAQFDRSTEVQQITWDEEIVQPLREADTGGILKYLLAILAGPPPEYILHKLLREQQSNN